MPETGCRETGFRIIVETGLFFAACGQNKAEQADPEADKETPPTAVSEPDTACIYDNEESVGQGVRET